MSATTLAPAHPTANSTALLGVSARVEKRMTLTAVKVIRVGHPAIRLRSREDLGDQQRNQDTQILQYRAKSGTRDRSSVGLRTG